MATETATAPVESLRHQPVLTTPYNEPTRHWQTVDSITQDVVVPYRRKAEQPLPEGQGVAIQQRLDSSEAQGPIDLLRDEVRAWRQQGWPGASHATRELLEYWSRPQGEGPAYSPFYAQREAVETVVFLTEVAGGGHDMVRRLKTLGQDWSGGLTRLAIRMATGTGKTMVMACLIAWYAVNRRREHRASADALARNVDRIVVICPGRTIKDRLAGLDPRGTDNIFDAWRLVPPALRPRLGGIAVNILNWEKLQPKTGVAFDGVDFRTGSGWLSRTRAIDLADGEAAFEETETLHEMWSRLLGPPRQDGAERVVVLNDEGHHCWHRKEGKGKSAKDAGVWMRALHGLASHSRHRLAQAIDLSATPIFIDPANTFTPPDAGRLKTGLVPWVVSEFALMEAMEAGLVKVPQLPKHDSTGGLGDTVLKNLFEANQGKALDTTAGMALVRQGADVLYADYRQTFDSWQAQGDPRIGHPVLIVVANNKKNARAIFEMLGGRRGPQGELEASDYELLSNVPHTGAADDECAERTILVLSKGQSPEKLEHEQLSGGALGLREVSEAGKGGATDEEMRTVLQSVAVPGKPGAEVRCVVSVGMLTEGWDCQRVTHILGYRKFGSQLLCEQTMGRALRRRDYDNHEDVATRDTGEVERRYPVEYATVFGVPFARAMSGGEAARPRPPQPKTEVRPVPERVAEFRIHVPDFKAYAVAAPGLRLALDAARVGTAPAPKSKTRSIESVDAEGAVGESKTILRPRTEQQDSGTWLLAADLVRALSERVEEQGEAEAVGRQRRAVLFGECLRVVREWLALVDTTARDLEDAEARDAAQSQMLDAIVVDDAPALKLGVPADDRNPLRSAGDWQKFETGLKDIAEDLAHSELNVAACHSRLEVEIAEHLDRLQRVASFVRNHGPQRFEIPFKSGGGWAKYVPDFFVRCVPHDGRSVHIVLEGKGQPDERSETKAWWTDNWWIPCANAAGQEHGQVWVRREIGSVDQLEAAIESAISEGLTEEPIE